jgi:aldose 1-epimerase
VKPLGWRWEESAGRPKLEFDKCRTFSDAMKFHHLQHSNETGVTRAVVAPGWGANVMELSFQSHEWDTPVPVLEEVDIKAVSRKPSSYGIPILAPTPGRVGQNQNGSFRYMGESHTVSPSRHGFLRDVPWGVSQHSSSEVTCCVDVHAGSLPELLKGFPYMFTAVYDVRVRHQAVVLRVSLQNTANYVQPLNVGWHPYLHRSDRCRVCIPSSERWELDGNPEPVPTGRILPVSGEDDFRLGRYLDVREHWDDVFTGLEGQNGVVTCWVEEQCNLPTTGRERVRATLRRFVRFSIGTKDSSPGLGNIQLYTPPARRAICLEPLSCPPDAVNLLSQEHSRADVCNVAPGDEVQFEIMVGISVGAGGRDT